MSNIIRMNDIIRRSDIIGTNSIIGVQNDLEEFKRVYSVFSEKPYEELITNQELEEIFTEYQQGGIIFGASHRGKCVGLVALKDGEQEDIPVRYEKEKRIAYLGDVAVLKEYRKRGLGTQLMIFAQMCVKELGYDTLYMRTLQEGSMSRDIALKLGFTQIPGIVQDVERKRIDGTTRSLPNIFLECDVRSLDKKSLRQSLAMARKEIAGKTEEKGMEIGE